MSNKNTQNNRRPKICFVSAMSLLDRRSGAATTMRNALECLSRWGFECHSITASLFDVGGNDFTFAEASGTDFDFKSYTGKAINFRRSKIDQTIYVTKKPGGQNMTVDEIKSFYRVAQSRLSEIKPDIVISYGSSTVAQALRQLAKKMGAYVIFYLSNPSYKDPAVFNGCDKVICPSEFIAHHYRDKLGLKAEALRCMQLFEQFVTPDERSIFFSKEGRSNGFVTIVNPNPVKGGALFHGLLEMASRERPDITFLALESRASLAQWKAVGYDFEKFSNLWWLRSQKEMARVYKRTSVLIFPAFWAETSGRTLAEAQLSGIPVVASDRGGNKEQLNGAGHLLNIPDRCTTDYLAAPSQDEVRPWLERICSFLDNDELYRKATESAFLASEPFKREHREKALFEFFQDQVSLG